METLNELFEWFNKISPKSLNGALFLLLFGYLFKIGGNLYAYFRTNYIAKKNADKARHKTFTDFMLYTIFMDDNLKVVTSDIAIDNLKNLLKTEGNSFRPYIAVISDQSIFEEIKQERHYFTDASEMATIDSYIENAKLFEFYYLKLESDAFCELSFVRKEAVLENLVQIGENIKTEKNKLIKIDGFQKIHAEITASIESQK